MRLNGNIKTNEKIGATKAQNILQVVTDAITKSLNIDLQVYVGSKQHDEEIKKFFNTYYTKTNTNGVVSGLEHNIVLSTNESEIINFFNSNDSSITPFLFVDHAGRGKSTLLKYVAYYLPTISKIASKFYTPIYVSLRDYDALASELPGAKEFHDFLDERIKEKAYSIANDYLKDNYKKVLAFLNTSNPGELQGLYPEEVIEPIESIGIFLSGLADKDPMRHVQLIIGTLCYISIHEKPIVLFLDDADNFELDIQHAILRYAGIMIQRGFRVLVSLRHSSWQALQHRRKDFQPKESSRIDWSFETIASLLETRIDVSLSVELEAIFIVDGYEITAQNLIRSFVDLVKKPEAFDFLIKTSNFNLRSLMGKFDLIAASPYFTDTFLLREEMIENLTKNKKHGMTIHAIYHLVLGSVSGTFVSDERMATRGLINCFCTRDEKHASYTFFARLHILSKLRDHCKENRSVKLSYIYEEYSGIFGGHFGFTKVFHRTIYKLIQGGLIVTKSFKRYKSEDEVAEHIDDDAVYIAECGLYYLTELFTRWEYLYFVKDDVDWPEYCDLTKITIAKPDDVAIKKHRDSLTALSLLMSLEIKMLREIKDGIDGLQSKELAQKYIHGYSALNINSKKRSVLFTKLMFESYKYYFEKYYKETSYKNKLKNELESINCQLTDYSDTIQEFSS